MERCFYCNQDRLCWDMPSGHIRCLSCATKAGKVSYQFNRINYKPQEQRPFYLDPSLLAKTASPNPLLSDNVRLHSESFVYAVMHPGYDWRYITSMVPLESVYLRKLEGMPIGLEGTRVMLNKQDVITLWRYSSEVKRKYYEGFVYRAPNCSKDPLASKGPYSGLAPSSDAPQINSSFAYRTPEQRFKATYKAIAYGANGKRAPVELAYYADTLVYRDPNGGALTAQCGKINNKSTPEVPMLPKNAYVLFCLGMDGDKVEYPIWDCEKRCFTVQYPKDGQKFEYIFDRDDLTGLLQELSAKYCKVLIAKVQDVVSIQVESLLESK